MPRPVVNAWPARSARVIRSIASGNSSSNRRTRLRALPLQEDHGAHGRQQRRQTRPTPQPSRSHAWPTSTPSMPRHADASSDDADGRLDAGLLDQPLRSAPTMCRARREQAVERRHAAQALDLALHAAWTRSAAPATPRPGACGAPLGAPARAARRTASRSPSTIAERRARRSARRISHRASPRLS